MTWKNLLDERNWPTKTAVIFLVAITILLLAPFSNKAFNIDDPLFIWAAKQIQSNPFDPYGFYVNWYLYWQKMSQVTMNPPLTAYYIALASNISGWSEAGLHLAFLIPNIAAILGVYFLAKKICSRPILASILTLIAPAFLVSSTSIMCDVMMMAFWLWAAVFWIRGIEENRRALLLISALLIALSSLTKYYGINLVFLLFLYTVIKKRGKILTILLYLLLPCVILVIYRINTLMLYGVDLFFEAGAYSNTYHMVHDKGLLIKQGLEAFAFLGGCFLMAIFYIPVLWSKRTLIFQSLFFMATIFIVRQLSGTIEVHLAYFNGVLAKYFWIFQIALFVFVGINIIILAFSDLYRNRRKPSAESAMLFCWIAGTFIFAGFINWTNNARSILPMAPAVAMVLVRGMDIKPGFLRKIKPSRLVLLAIPAAVMSILITLADYSFANASRDAAYAICEKYHNRNSKIWFEGHWGFQYYMDKNNAHSLSFNEARAKLSAGDIVAIPFNNTNGFMLPPNVTVSFCEVMEFPVFHWASTMSVANGTGFYSSIYGPIPFAFGSLPNERYSILRIESVEEAMERHDVINNISGRGESDVAMFTKMLSRMITSRSYDGKSGASLYKEICVKRGTAYYNNGEYDKAISDYTNALIMDRYEFRGYYTRGNVYLAKKEYPKAIADYNFALKLYPDFKEARERLLKALDLAKHNG